MLIIEGIFGLHPKFLEAFGNVSLFKARSSKGTQQSMAGAHRAMVGCPPGEPVHRPRAPRRRT